MQDFYGCRTIAIWCHKIDGFIKIYDGFRYSVLFAPEIYNTIYDTINYLITEKSGDAYSINHNFPRIIDLS